MTPRLHPLTRMSASDRLHFAARYALRHLILSLLVALASAAVVFGLWYPAPYRQMLAVDHIYLLVLAVDVLAEPSASGATERTTCMRIREDTLIMSPRFSHPDYTVGSGISPDQPLARVAGFLPYPL